MNQRQTKTKQPRITVGSLVRDRAWILPEFLEAIKGLDYPKEMISLHFILNDSSDKSYAILDEFYKDNEEDYYTIRIDTINLKAPQDTRYNRANDKLYKNLAFLRNKLVKHVMEWTESEYLFSIDSDIIVKPNTLNKLVKNNKEIVAAMVKNSAKYFNAGYINEEIINSINHLTAPPSGLRKVEWTGAVCLYNKSVFEKGLKYIDHPLGEDIGLSVLAKEMGIEMWVDGTEILEHKMLFHNIDGSERGIKNFIKEAQNEI